MRPVHLEVEGFASFRDRVRIDFTDAELFVLFGPTGAGKSSVIDALTFALYGSVPRYDDTRLVAPVISQGMNEARVRLDFAVAGVEYTAVRVVRRTKTGATTREARLQQGEHVRAGTAADLTAAVEKLLGLPFQHFTRCVVLPQGDFADFLHATASERQDLLIKLLDLDVYRRVAQSANQRAAESSNRARLIEERLQRELACATDEALADAGRRVNDLEALLDTLERGRTELTALVDALTKAEAAARAAAARAELLRGVRMPDGVAELTRALDDASRAARAATDELSAAVAAREREEERRAALPERAVLEAALEKHAKHATLTDRDAAAERDREQAAAAAAGAAAALEGAQSDATIAEEALARVRRERAAAHLAEHLHAGDPCPVCGQTVASVPEHEAPPELEAARTLVGEKAAAFESARAAHAAAERALALRERDVDHIRRELDALGSELDQLPFRDAAVAQLETIGEIEHALGAARERERTARAAAGRAQRRSEQLDAERQTARRTLANVLRELAGHALAPPAHDTDDPGGAWQAVVAWAGTAAPLEQATADNHTSEAERARREFDARAAEQLAACAAAGIDVGRREPRDACADALARARAERERITRDLESARRLRGEHETVTRQGALARELGRMLDARNFERWLMNRALRQLVAGATRVLRELSDGAYSLVLDEKNEFQVIDHRNADERRIARTLSGGETFLASLALALALAEHVADLASAGAARLDALFLDEGFGTLDADTLDTVAAAIEELGSRGRMVGLVTHVRDLAERIPVRFEVRKVGSVSSVERVER